MHYKLNLRNYNAAFLLPSREKFVAIMSEMGNEFESVATKMADAQSLWDATMVSQTSTYSTLVSNCIKSKE